MHPKSAISFTNMEIRRELNIGAELLCIFCSDTFKSATNGDTLDKIKVSLLMVLSNKARPGRSRKVQGLADTKMKNDTKYQRKF